MAAAWALGSGSGVLAQEAAPAAGATPAAPSSVVTKVAEDFTGQLWKPSQWSKASGKFTLENEKAPDTSSEKSMKVEVGFSGGGFENFTASPERPIFNRTVALRDTWARIQTRSS